MNAEILTIGTELLLGEITDTNTGYLARSLASLGVNVFRTTSVGDNAQRIAACIRESLSRVDLLITTGGLGPTVDDPTRDAVAMALGRKTEFHPELWETIQSMFKKWGHTASENNRRQAFLPEGAEAILNPVGTAPAFLVQSSQGTIISLPGVPLEMEALIQQSVLPLLRTRFQLSGVIKARLLHTVGLGESTIDEQINEFETLTNPTVGLAAHAGQVDIRLTSRADTEAEADALLDPLEAEIRQRLGNRIYGTDSTSLEEAALQQFRASGQSIAVIESGLGGKLSTALSSSPDTFLAAVVLPPMDPSAFITVAAHYRQTLQADILLCAHLRTAAGHQLTLQLNAPAGRIENTLQFGGPPEAAAQRAVNLSLDFLRSFSPPGTA